MHNNFTRVNHNIHSFTTSPQHNKQNRSNKMKKLKERYQEFKSKYAIANDYKQELLQEVEQCDERLSYLANEIHEMSKQINNEDT